MKKTVLMTIVLLAALAVGCVFAGSSVIAEGAALQKLPGDYAFTEGPATDAAGHVFFTDQPNDRIVKWNAETGQMEDWLAPAGRSNGMYFDRSGNLLTCADGNNELWSIAPDKQVTVRLNGYDGKRLNGPNDLWIRPDGGIYLTDPLYARPYWTRDKAMQQDGRHLYFLPAGASRAIRVDTELTQPNGLIGSPDGTVLYVADIGAGKTYAYDIQTDGRLTRKRLFCEMGSDGMTVDECGNVYLTGQGVTVFDKTGSRIEHIEVPGGWTANVTFGGTNRTLLFITASRSVYTLDMAVKGGH